MYNTLSVKKKHVNFIVHVDSIQLLYSVSKIQFCWADVIGFCDIFSLTLYLDLLLLPFFNGIMIVILVYSNSINRLKKSLYLWKLCGFVMLTNAQWELKKNITNLKFLIFI
jgi:hypothetical protein